MKYKLFTLAVTLASTMFAQNSPDFKLVLDQDFNHRSDQVYTEALLKEDFDKVFPRTAAEIRGFRTNNTPQITRISNKKIRAHFRKNKVGGREGGFLFDALIEKSEEAYLQYDFNFDDDFVWALGGKLPGLGGSSKPLGSRGVIPSGCTGTDSDSQKNGFSCRLMWRTRRSVPEKDKKPFLVVYTYLPGRTNRCGEDYRILDNLEKGKNYKIKQYIKLNTPGTKDGVLKMWVNNSLVLNATNVRFRDSNNVKIDALVAQTYRGGGAADLDWASPIDNYAFFDNFKVWVKDDTPTTTTTTNQLPSADISTPSQDITITEGYDNLEVIVDATDSDGSIEKVDLYVNGTFLRSERTAPYIFGRNNNELLGLNIGENRLRAEVVDNRGGVTKKFRKIIVEQNANQAPLVSFSNPTQNTSVEFGYETLEVNVNATDSDGSITKVELFVDDQLIGTQRSAPYNFGKNNNQLLGLAVGNHVFKAVATENEGLKAETTFVLTVKSKPTVSFVGINEEVNLIDGYDNFKVDVNATDGHEDITEVRLYLNGELIRIERVAPYEWGHNLNRTTAKELLNIPVGQHVIRAVALNAKNVENSNSFVLNIEQGVTLSLGDHTKDANNKVILYPNPVRDNNLYVKGLPNSQQNVDIYNLSGQKVLSTKSSSSSIQINTSNMPKGAYILRVDQLNQSKVFIVE